MAEAYQNKLRIRIENLVGPKRKVDITSCSFMKDLAKELQKEFKSDMQRMFRIRETAQANRDRLSHKEEERLEEKPFFREDSDDEWCPYYSEESDEDISSTGSPSDEEKETGRKELKAKAVSDKEERGEKTEEEWSDGAESEQEVAWTEDGVSEEEILKQEVPLDEEAPGFMQDEPRPISEETEEEFPQTTPLDAGNVDVDLEHKYEGGPEEYKDEMREYHETPLTKESSIGLEKKVERKKAEDRISIFSYEEVFQEYKAPIVEQIEQEESIDALFALSEMNIRMEEKTTPAEYEFDEESNGPED